MYHLDKCQSGKIQDATIEPDDIIISHFIEFEPRKLKKHILSCHEKAMFSLKKRDLSQYDVIQFVSNQQKKFHSVNHPSVIIPPMVRRFEWKKPNTGTAGVIGSVDRNKQTHKAIEAALDRGFKVNVYGKIAPQVDYFQDTVKKYMTNPNVFFAGQYDDIEKMYNEIDEVFHYSQSETFGLVEAECRMNGIPYNGNHYYPEPEHDEEILKRWKKLLDD